MSTGQKYDHPVYLSKAGYKQEKFREIDLLNEARKPLYDYLQEGKRAEKSHYIFTSQRAKSQLPDGDLDGWRLTEDGIHQWFQEVRAQATSDEIDLVDDITFHDLRHDFGHRLREAGWTLEEIAYYLGHITAAGTPAIQTTVRYTQVGRDQIKEKLRGLRSI
jgi:integrase